MLNNNELLIENQKKLETFGSNSKSIEQKTLESDDKAYIHCPICGAITLRNGRCLTCLSCGWSTCSI